MTLERETLHIMDDKQRIALVETQTPKSTDRLTRQLIRYQFGNHLGSASLELDDAGADHLLRGVLPLRQHVVSGGAQPDREPKRYRYTGKERDEETGLSYHGARYYAPWLGRWTSCDPAEMADGMNLYRYSQDNPVNLVDSDGRQSGSTFGKARQKGGESNPFLIGTGKEGPEAVEDVMRRLDAQGTPVSIVNKPFHPQASDFYSDDSLRCYKPTMENLAKIRAERFEAMLREAERAQQQRVDDRPNAEDVNDTLGEAATNIGIGVGGVLPPGFLQQPGAMRGAGAAATRSAAVVSVQARRAELKQKLREVGEVEEQMRTIGIHAVRTDDGGYRLVITTSYKDRAFENQVRGWLRPGEAYLPAKENRGDTGHHAEQVIEGIPDGRILVTAATKDICTGCQQRIRQTGAVAGSDIRERVPPMRINMVRESEPRPVRVNLLRPRLAPGPRQIPRLPARSK